MRPHRALRTTGCTIVHDVRDKHIEALKKIGLADSRTRLVYELNVIEQVANVSPDHHHARCGERGQDVAVHGGFMGCATVC